MYKEVNGDLILMAKQGTFDAIAHGCNCFCRQKRGLAPQMAAAFGTDKYPSEMKGISIVWGTGATVSEEAIQNEGDINKLGQIEWGRFVLDAKLSPHKSFLYVVNCYTQYQWGTELKPFDYDAFTLCMRKMNHVFKGKHIGLPQIGSHLAGGNWARIMPIIKQELRDCDVTVVIYKP